MAAKCIAFQASVRPVLHVARPHSRIRSVAWAGRRSQPALSIRLQPLLAASTDEAPGLAEPTEAPEPTGALEATEAAETPAVAADETDPAQVPSSSDIPNPAGYMLTFLWLEKNIAVSVDQVFSEVQRSPLTEYFFWPRKDAWEELKSALESKPWVSERDKVLLLNKTTEVINFWQDDEKKHSLEEAQEKFPDCKFSGY